jgi:hypothetical protein
VRSFDKLEGVYENPCFTWFIGWGDGMNFGNGWRGPPNFRVWQGMGHKGPPPEYRKNIDHLKK